MKLLIQRVSEASVTIDGCCAGKINAGLAVLVGVRHGDTEKDARQLATKTLNLRVFADSEGRMNLSILDIKGSILAVSQFTLYADTRKGNRPSFIQAAEPGIAERLYDAYVEALRAVLGPERVQTGRFAADMSVLIRNDGPVTIELSTDPASGS